GQQDNSSVKIASRSFRGGINTTNWSASAGGESAFLAFDPNNPRYVLGGSYQGTIEVLDSKSTGSTQIMAAPIQYLGKDAKDDKYRFNWNAPIIWSKHEPHTFYHGSQVLLRTTDTGRTWTEASPDLTRNEKSKQGKPGGPYTNEAVGAENYGTLSYIMESPNEKGVIYTGSDDGFVQLTRDDGKTWKNVTPAGLPECLINSIEVSTFDNATAYIATTRYKFDDHAPGLYKTTDYGKTWTKINNGIAPNAFTRVIREDTKVKDLLFAGTEFGIYMSRNGGKNWMPFQLNLPKTPITDLRIHQDNLIASTSGRSFWILDDLGLFRQYKKDTSTVIVYQPTRAYVANGYSELDRNDDEFKGSKLFEGVNPATGVVVYYQLPALKENEAVTLEIKDATGSIVRKFSSVTDSSKGGRQNPPDPKLSARKGLNRFVWDMRYPGIPTIPNVFIESSFRGHKAIPGTYTITVRAGNQTSTTTAEIAANPLYNVSEKEYKEYDALMKQMEGEVTTMHTMINDLYESKNQLENVIKNLPSETKYSAVKMKADSVVKLLNAWDEDMIQRKSKAYDDVENFPNKFTANYMFMVNQTESEIPRVNQPVLDLLKEYTPIWEALKARGLDLKNKVIPALNKQLWEAGVGAVWVR
ncbi:MAG: glycosyl hydrolase, partial [Bacteroidota bacterium]|nr:glycosyl hydrolase [Bacteroidota bacterium]